MAYSFILIIIKEIKQYRVLTIRNIHRLKFLITPAKNFTHGGRGAFYKMVVDAS